ncbi:ATP-binding protein [Hymenobacter guriensis]|uniref:ATP-binding protein n=1 Tax=Hymenobacter guriensis TaxID=2793065 RepID=A0ABS0L4K3_9BACT|nr:ATP-binding protein [Hymenobacter guriensis]MBG8555052.1 ATP-binding protein [Hymenobacter guriensis]
MATSFAHLSQFTAACLAGRPTESLPATELQLNSRETVLIDNIHHHSDWVVTFDRHLGPELFDLPVTAGQTPFLLDFIPGKQFLGVSTFLTSKPGAELTHLLAPVVQKLVGSLSTTTVEAQTQLILNDLRAVSGSLVMNLSSQPTENRVTEYAGIALAKRLLEKQGLLRQQFMIPLDLHQHLFRGDETDSKQRADLLLVDVDVRTRTIHFQVVEIKARYKSLNINGWDELCGEMNKQLDNTIDHLRRRFAPEPYSGYTRFDQALRARELSELLLFYAARAKRYGLLTDGESLDLTAFLQALPEQPYQLEFTRRGLVFNLLSPVRVVRHELADDTVFYHVGQSGIQALLDPDSEFNTRRPTPEWHQLPTDLTRRHPSLPDTVPTTTAEVPLARPASPASSAASLVPSPVSQLDSTVAQNSSVPADASPAATAAPEPAVAPISPALVPAPGVVETSTALLDDTSSVAAPAFEIYIGENETSAQYGLLGRTAGGQRIALDLNGTQTISLFGVQGAGKSYSIGTITEMVLQSIPNVNNLPKPLAGVIFHYSQSQDYKPEFTSMVNPNQKPAEVNRLREWYDACPQGIADVMLLVPEAKLAERRAEYPELQVEPLTLSSAELSIADWRFLMGTTGSQALYMKHLNSIMRGLRGQLTLDGLRAGVQNSSLLTTSQRDLALSRLSLAADYIDDSVQLGRLLAPGRLLVVDLRDEFLDQDDALGLFVIMLNIFANVRLPDGQPFNKFIVFDEAHKYMGNEELTDSIVTAIREMRHKGVSLLIASQDPPSLPNAIIELSSAVLVHRFNSPQWLKHVQKSIVQFNKLTPADLAQLGPGEAFLWASRATNKAVTQQPIKIVTRPRVTQHGGSTLKASE